MSGRRKTFVERFVSRLRGRGAILFYHRVGIATSDPWNLLVSPDELDAQLEHVARTLHPVPLAELADRVARGRSIRDLVAITFDDGYLDNLVHALPLLEKHGVPATFFVTTRILEDARPFWWDTLHAIFFGSTTLPPRLELATLPERTVFELGDASTLSEAERERLYRWRTTEAPPNARARLFEEVWRAIHRQPAERQAALAEDLRAWAGSDAAASAELLGREGLLALARSPYATIGAHSVTHVSLPEQSIEAQRHEIVESKRALEAVLGRTVDGFAYPYGDNREATVRLVAEAGYRHAVTTRSTPVFRSSQVHALPRFHAAGFSRHAFGDELAACMRGDGPTRATATDRRS